MGVVYLGRDPKLGRPVAIKVLPPTLASDRHELGWFEREARMLATLNHPNIATIYGLEEGDDGSLFFVLEHIEGESLAERLHRGRLGLDETIQVCDQIAAALEAAHEKGVIHRDLKPGNVMITTRGLVKVLDFGLAKLSGGAKDPQTGPIGVPSRTAMGLAVGTPGYMSPEHVRGGEQDERTDIFAFGCVLFECLAGTRAFTGATPGEILVEIVTGEPAWSALPPGLPVGIRELVLASLEKSPDGRPPNMVDVRRRLGGGGSRTGAPPPSNVVRGLAGRKLGQYEVVETLHEGHAGETYRALDTRKGREIVLRPVPPETAASTARLLQLERTIKTLTTLGHPNVASVYGLEKIEGGHFIVQEFVEGESLAARLKRGLLPIQESLGILYQVVSALDAAHREGVFHLDLRPANVILGPGDAVKLIGFGMGKALPPRTGGYSNGKADDPITMDTLNTASYMSPEQVRGEDPNRQTDIWAFGCLLYECLNGRPAFRGATVSDTLAAVLRTEHDLTNLSSRVPMSMWMLLNRCLQRDSERRLHDIADAKIEIRDILESRGEVQAWTATLAPPAPRWRRFLPWTLAGAAVLVAALTLWLGSRPHATAVTRLEFNLGSSGPRSIYNSANAILSPDGARIVHVVNDSLGTQLYTRLLREDTSHPIANTRDAYNPFFSPDGLWIGYSTHNALFKTAFQGGTPMLVCSLPADGGATWLAGGTIVFAPELSGGLWTVASDGGTPKPLTEPDRGKFEVSHRWPERVDNTDVVLFTMKTDIQSFDEASLVAMSVRRPDARVILPLSGMNPKWAETGHILFARAGKLQAVPFDPRALKINGPSVPVPDLFVLTNPNHGTAQFSISDNGSLLYDPSQMLALRDTLAWVDASGGQEVLSTQGAFYEPTLSPDGERAVLWMPAANDKLWMCDLARGDLVPLTSGPGNDYRPRWSPDGSRIAFGSDRAGVGIYILEPDSEGEPARVAEGRVELDPTGWSPDGKILAYDNWVESRNRDIFLYRVGEGDSRPFLATASDEGGARFSPDGRWIAYESDVSGALEVYAQAFPAGVPARVSRDGGQFPQWSPDGSRIYYVRGNEVCAAEVIPGDRLVFGSSTQVFRGNFREEFCINRTDGRFLFIRPDLRVPSPPNLKVVLNWFNELRAK